MDKPKYFCVGCNKLFEFTSVPKTLYCPRTHKIEAVLLDIILTAWLDPEPITLNK